MKKFILCLIISICGMFSASAQRVVVHFGCPCDHEYYEYRHTHQCPPPMRGPRYYYAPRHFEAPHGPMHGPGMPPRMHGPRR